MDAYFTILADEDEGAELRLQHRIDHKPGGVDRIQFPLDRVEPRVGGVRLSGAILERGFELVDQMVVLDRQGIDPRLLLRREVARGRVIFMKLALQIVGHAGRENRRHEGEAFHLGELGGSRIQFRLGKLFDDGAVLPAFIHFGGKQVTRDRPACLDIGITTDEARHRIGGLGRAVQDRAFDGVGRIAVIAGLHLVEDLGLGGRCRQ